MTKNVLDIGNCDPDHHALKRMLTSHFDIHLLRAHQLADALKLLETHPIDLVLINRKLDIDYTDGSEILRQLKQNDAFKSIPVMIITNYEEHQLAAVAEGAEYGFGKLQYSDKSTLERLTKFLDPN